MFYLQFSLSHVTLNSWCKFSAASKVVFISSIHHVKLLHLCQNYLSSFKRLNVLPTLLSIFNDHWVFNQKGLKVTCLIDLRHQFTLAYLATLIDKESHDSFRYLIRDGFLNNAVVAVDQVLYHSCLHDDAGTFLVVCGAHRPRDLLKDHIFEIMATVSHVASNI